MKPQYLFAILGIFLIAFVCCEARHTNDKDLSEFSDLNESVLNSHGDFDDFNTTSENNTKEISNEIDPIQVKQKTKEENDASVKKGKQEDEVEFISPGNTGDSVNPAFDILKTAFSAVHQAWETYRKHPKSIKPFNQYEFMSPQFQAYLNDERNTREFEDWILEWSQQFDSSADRSKDF